MIVGMQSCTIHIIELESDSAPPTESSAVHVISTAGVIVIAVLMTMIMY